MPCQRFKANAAKGITAAIGAILKAMFSVKNFASELLTNLKFAKTLSQLNVNQLNKLLKKGDIFYKNITFLINALFASHIFFLHKNTKY